MPTTFKPALTKHQTDAALCAKAVGDIARARGMMQLPKGAGITREGLYKALV